MQSHTTTRLRSNRTNLSQWEFPSKPSNSHPIDKVCVNVTRYDEEYPDIQIHPSENSLHIIESHPLDKVWAKAHNHAQVKLA